MKLLTLLILTSSFFVLFPFSSYSQDLSSFSTQTNSEPNPSVIFQMKKKGIGDRTQSGIDSLLFRKHSLSSSDSVLFIYQKHFNEIVNLQNFLPTMIQSLTVLKNVEHILEKYLVNNTEGLLIFYFKDETEYWNLLTTNNY